MHIVIVLAAKEDTAAIAAHAQQEGMAGAGWAWLGVDSVGSVQAKAKSADSFSQKSIQALPYIDYNGPPLHRNLGVC